MLKDYLDNNKKPIQEFWTLSENFVINDKGQLITKAVIGTLSIKAIRENDKKEIVFILK